MAKIVGQIGPLTYLLDELKKEGVDLFETLVDLIEFNSNYGIIINKKKNEIKHNLTQEIIRLKNDLLENEKDYKSKIIERENELNEELKEIDDSINSLSIKPKNILVKIYSKIKLMFLKKRKLYLEENFEEEKRQPYSSLEKIVEILKDKIDYLEENFKSVHTERYQIFERKYELAKSIIKENYSVLLGAIGEQKAVDELRKLPDSYYVINDFKLYFYKPIYHKESQSYIKSIQADHIVISPSGIFLIETKNWGIDSIENRDLYSPIEQIKRTSFALFIYLNNKSVNSSLNLNHHWGQRKINVRNILLMVNIKPSQEFQFVKMLSLKELNGYIKYFKSVLTDSEVEALFNELSYNL